MLQTDRMPKLVDAFFKRSLEEQILVGILAIELGTQAVNGYDGCALLLVCVTKKKPVPSLIEVELRNCKQQRILDGMRANDLRC